MPTQRMRPPTPHGQRTPPRGTTGKRPTNHPARKRSRGNRLRVPHFVLLLVLLFALLAAGIYGFTRGKEDLPGWVSVQIVDINGSGRRGQPLQGVKDIAIHYVGNPGTTAQGNHDFYNQPDTKVSSHFVIGLEGEVIQCVPLDEKSSATNDRNLDTISIEVCHPDATGQFTEASYQSLVKLTAWLCDHFNLDRSHVIRHYDVTGKPCPLYFVEHPEAWTQFLADVKAY